MNQKGKEFRVRGALYLLIDLLACLDQPRDKPRHQANESVPWLAYLPASEIIPSNIEPSTKHHNEYHLPDTIWLRLRPAKMVLLPVFGDNFLNGAVASHYEVQPLGASTNGT